MITVRDMTTADAETIVTLINELMAYQNIGSTTITPADLLRNSGLTLEHPEKLCRVIMAEEHKEILGFAMYFYMYSSASGKSMYLEDIYVRTVHRGRKVGHELLRELARVAAANNTDIRLEVISWNKSAIGFYEKNGARHYYTKDSGWLGYVFDKEVVVKLACDREQS